MAGKKRVLIMKAASKKASNQNESRAAAHSIFLKKKDEKWALGFEDHKPRPAASHHNSVPNRPVRDAGLQRFKPGSASMSNVETPPHPRPHPHPGVVVIQMNGNEVHNWEEVLNKYFGGQAGKDIDDAFARAGYGNPTVRRKAILKALRETGWGKSKIAHALGGSQSKMRGGTKEKIAACKKDVLNWLRTNPPTGREIEPTSRRRKKRSEGGEEEDYNTRILILQLAKWAREGDTESLESLRKWAAGGNVLAREKLAEIEGVTESSESSEEGVSYTEEQLGEMRSDLTHMIRHLNTVALSFIKRRTEPTINELGPLLALAIQYGEALLQKLSDINYAGVGILARKINIIKSWLTASGVSIRFSQDDVRMLITSLRQLMRVLWAG